MLAVKLNIYPINQNFFRTIGLIIALFNKSTAYIACKNILSLRPMSFQGKTVAFHTLGCKLNFSETSTIARAMQEKGFEKIAFDQGADVYVINTCSELQALDHRVFGIKRV